MTEIEGFVKLNPTRKTGNEAFECDNQKLEARLAAFWARAIQK